MGATAAAGRRRRRLALLFACAAAALAAPATAHGADRIYWSNFDSGNPARTIAYRNLDGSGGLNLNTTGATVDGAMGMALDPSHGRVYWTNWGADIGMGHGHGTTISYANLDGSGGAATCRSQPGSWSARTGSRSTRSPARSTGRTSATTRRRPRDR